MPRITLFGRSVDIATDDLFTPFSLILFLRLIWLCLAIVSIVSLSDCVYSNHGIYLVTVIAMSALNIPVELFMIIFSLSGSLKTPGIRRFCTVS